MSSPTSTFPAVTRPVYWTVRRELWENRSIYLAPAIVGVLETLAILISAILFPHNVQIQGDMDVGKMQFALGAVYGGLGLPILATALIVAAFYCLDALYSERRDRSILFWKSLPVSDTATVLGKALIPFLILPAVTLVVISVTQLATLLVSAAILKVEGIDTAILSGVPLITMPVVLAYSLLSMALWYAPLYGWLFLVSAFARRKTILWAILPPAGLCVLEGVAFRTHYAAQLLVDRFTGFLKAGFIVADPHHFVFTLDKLSPAGLLSTGGLWGGLAVAAILFAGAIQLRRYRGPV